MLLTRKSFIQSALMTGLAFTGLGLTACGDKKVASGEDMSMGSPDAKVTLIEYASVTCTHCAEFNEKIFPDLKAKYIDTGKVRYVYREFLTGPADVSAAGILMARCAGEDKYFTVIDAIMRAQKDIFAGDGKGVLKRIANSAGLSDEEFTQCVTDKAGIERINKNMDTYTKTYNITGTPAFFINDKKFEGDPREFAEFEAAIKAAEAGAK